MAELTLTVAGRNYAIACRDGEEPHLRHLADRVDRKANDARAAVGDTSEPRLLLLAALLLADELHEQEAASPSASSPSPPTLDTASVARLTMIADSLEKIATRLEA